MASKLTSFLCFSLHSNNIKHQQQHKVEMTSSYEDWTQIRECFVRSFHHYPLYKYMIPDSKLRSQFMRKYFDANYEVTVGAGKAILLSIKVPRCQPRSAPAPATKWQLGEEGDRGVDDSKIIGGVMFLLPSHNSFGWQANEQTLFDEAYDRHGLAEVSPDGLARLKRLVYVGCFVFTAFKSSVFLTFMFKICFI